MVPDSSDLDVVPEINHSFLKSHSSPLILLENPWIFTGELGGQSLAGVLSSA